MVQHEPFKAFNDLKRSFKAADGVSDPGIPSASTCIEGKNVGQIRRAGNYCFAYFHFLILQTLLTFEL